MVRHLSGGYAAADCGWNRQGRSVRDVICTDVLSARVCAACGAHTAAVPGSSVAPSFGLLRHAGFLLVREIAAIVGVALPQVQVLFPAWLLFYVLGLDWGKVGRAATRRCSLLPGLLVACLFLQLVSGFAWLARGDYNMATTQLKLSSMATSAVLVVLIGLTGHRLRQLFARSHLVKLGDLSFGIYLCHILVLSVVTKVLGFVAIPPLMATVVNLAVTLVVSACVVAAGATLLPRKVCEVLGFV